MFLEERIAVDVRYGSTYADDYNVEITTTASGAEYRRLVHAFPVRKFDISFVKSSDKLYADVVNLYHRVFGRFAGFRAKALDDYTTNGRTSAPTATDQTLSLVSAGIYQLRKEYGADKPGLSTGFPARTIYKPVASTTLVSISGISAAGWTVSAITGQVTFSANKTANITGITQASSAVVTVGAHTFVVNESGYFSSVVGMTQINGLRGLITAITGTTITVAIDSTLFSAYSSGGAVNTRPQTGEAVKGGCEFDIPVRFDSAIDIEQLAPSLRDSGSIQLVELLNPNA